MKRFLTISVLLAVTLISAFSCGETKEFDDHANWQERNVKFIDSIAIKCDLNSQAYTSVDEIPVGQLFKLLSISLNPDNAHGNGSYVYCIKLKNGDDTISPKYTDSIRVNYRVRLMPTHNYPEGQVVDQSFKTADLDPSVNIPSSFAVSGLIDGVATALSYMHCGDYWKLYIPQQLGYGTTDKTSIPGYSALIFEINLTEIARTGKELSPR
ncbi:MAG: FKBP-type peptidyl-prolyl cis-trans isomerase [Bacteroidaceae bacterium]|nr:FKBP-type peptidyl-prolyl cis-trans isomerase [Bacteroidaceae bacterium]